MRRGTRLRQHTSPHPWAWRTTSRSCAPCRKRTLQTKGISPRRNYRILPTAASANSENDCHAPPHRCRAAVLTGAPKTSKGPRTRRPLPKVHESRRLFQRRRRVASSPPMPNNAAAPGVGINSIWYRTEIAFTPAPMYCPSSSSPGSNPPQGLGWRPV